jgi:MFS family permease
MRDLIFGVLEASYGIGFTLGPLIGQLLYAKYGFKYCFLILSGILTLPMPLIYFMSFAKEEQLNISREKSKIIEEEITYG